MGVIYFSYGMTKSASSFVYQLEEKIFEFSPYNLVKIPSEIRGNKAIENYMEPITDEKIENVLEWLPEDAATVIKTHGPPSARVKELVNSGGAYASATYRDPRDIAVSLVDHGRKSREKGLQDFSEFKKPIDALEELERQYDRISPWLNLSGCLPLCYEKISQEPKRVVGEILAQLGFVEIEERKVLEAFQDKNAITHFNVGVSGRYESHMDQDEIQEFERRLGELIRISES